MKKYAVMYCLSGMWKTSATYETRAAADQAARAAREKWTGNAMMAGIPYKVFEIDNPDVIAIFET